jgi:hypothetical protein
MVNKNILSDEAVLQEEVDKIDALALEFRRYAEENKTGLYPESEASLSIFDSIELAKIAYKVIVSTINWKLNVHAEPAIKVELATKYNEIGE